jgi:hypothetical protein
VVVLSSKLARFCKSAAGLVWCATCLASHVPVTWKSGLCLPSVSVMWAAAVVLSGAQDGGPAAPAHKCMTVFCIHCCLTGHDEGQCW